MEISISEAARSLKISRNTIKKRIAEGTLSKTSDGKIETSELFRVFGSSPRPSRQTTNEPALTTDQASPRPAIDHHQTIYEHPEYKAQVEKIRMLEDTLRKAEDREQWQRGQIEKLTETVRLLEAPKELQQPTKRSWITYFFRK